MLARLDPALGTMITYALPLGTAPQMITLHHGRVWYSEKDQGTLGVLNPALAAGTTTSLASISHPLESTCRSLGAGTTATVERETGALAWVEGALEPILDAGGFAVYELPAGSSPYGLAGSAGVLWAADPGRMKLLRLQLPQIKTVFLPLAQSRAGR
jgi:streptogramin lyase